MQQGEKYKQKGRRLSSSIDIIPFFILLVVISSIIMSYVKGHGWKIYEEEGFIKNT